VTREQSTAEILQELIGQAVAVLAARRASLHHHLPLSAAASSENWGEPE
jgi:hypothetical protein